VSDTGPGQNVIDDHAHRRAQAGYDHNWYDWTPLPSRPPVSLPSGQGLAVCVVVDLTAVEWESPEVAVAVPPPGGRGIAPYPDLPRMSHREYGHRVGIFRLLDALAAAGIPAAVNIDVLTAEQYPALARHLPDRVAEILAAGISATRPITARMGPDEERAYIRATLDRLEAALGRRPSGWLGAQRGESANTPGLLAEAGLDYVADWSNDDQPYPLRSTAQGLWSLPMSWELSDLAALFLRGVSHSDYAASLEEAVEVMSGEFTGVTAQPTARMLGLHLHPWLAGQPYVMHALEPVLLRLARRDGVWFAPPGEVLAAFRG
jgi:allantoinase